MGRRGSGALLVPGMRWGLCGCCPLRPASGPCCCLRCRSLVPKPAGKDRLYLRGQEQAQPAPSPASRKPPRRVSARSKNELLANDVNHQVSVAAAV